MKICKNCLCEKEINLFSKDNLSKDGYRNECKDCRNIKLRKYRDNNKEFLFTKRNNKIINKKFI